MNPELLGDYPMHEIPWSALMCMRVFSDFVEGMDPKIREKSPIRFPVGFVFVSSRRLFVGEVLHKFPGSHQNKGDKTPLDTALREAEEETGIAVTRDRAKYASSKIMMSNQRRASPRHTLHLFYADLYEREARRMHNFHPHNGGEDPKLFTFADIQAGINASKIMNNHLEMSREAGLLLPPFKIAA